MVALYILINRKELENIINITSWHKIYAIIYIATTINCKSDCCCVEYMQLFTLQQRVTVHQIAIQHNRCNYLHCNND